ncbi:hypothetical protein CspeluHIS016_0105660 [Cutaneotrichosporon spelunceum]|uniref:Replication protein A C-terminal domain-containing protein n=1 Tax=Cutaneotrichosporon spelunceum TaxID=1672016 RepID=A0AAD3TPE6_9TREE|nr:hypothetical protein CspeluHIS016_0105660 [Cutaneotrichosporon spelunceum]
MSENPYYAGRDGGGFMQGGSPYGGSQQSPGGEGRKRNNQSLRPVTVQQILNADQPVPESDFQIDGTDVGPIQFVGTVHNMSSTATNFSYEIGDGYGYIDVRQWLDSSDDESGKTEGIEQDKYVSVIGTIKVFGGKRHVSAQTVRPIEDHNEVYHHFLKALQVSLSIRNPNAAKGGAAPAGNNANTDSYAAPAAGGGDVYGHLAPMQKKIMEVVSADTSGEGMHVRHVARLCGATSIEDVMVGIEQLMGQGLLYSTIDDLHVAAAT